eukprot:1159088-Pelagomonas_calceolata.AAC.2
MVPGRSHSDIHQSTNTTVYNTPAPGKIVSYTTANENKRGYLANIPFNHPSIHPFMAPNTKWKKQSVFVSICAHLATTMKHLVDQGCFGACAAVLIFVCVCYRGVCKCDSALPRTFMSACVCHRVTGPVRAQMGNRFGASKEGALQMPDANFFRRMGQLVGDTYVGECSCLSALECNLSPCSALFVVCWIGYAG